MIIQAWRFCPIQDPQLTERGFLLIIIRNSRKWVLFCCKKEIPAERMKPAVTETERWYRSWDRKNRIQRNFM